MKYFKNNIIIFLIFLLFVNCTDRKFLTPETEGEKLQILYSNAMELVKDRDFVDAAILFEDIERQYPYSKWSKEISNNVFIIFKKPLNLFQI